MAIPPLPPSHDSVRFIRPTLEETVTALLEHLQRRPNPWSYQKARMLAPFAFERGLSLAALKHACHAAPMIAAGRAATWEVVQLIYSAGSGRTVQCHGMEDGSVSIRKDLSLRVAADFYFVEGGRAKVFWLQPRRSFAMTDTQLAIFGALLRTALLKDDFADADVEILDLSAAPRQPREARRLGLGDLPPIAEEEVIAGLQRVADAYDIIAGMEIDWAALRQRGQSKKPPSDQGDLFPG